MMKLIKPQSILQLIALGFLAVFTPLIAGLVVVGQQLESLGTDSRHSVSASAEIMRIGRVLIEQTSTLERNARQYNVLGNEDLLQLYAERRQGFRQTLDSLAGHQVGAVARNEITQLAEREQSTFERLSQGVGAGSTDDFPNLLELSQQIARHINQWIDGQTETLATQAQDTIYFMRLLAVVLVSIAVLMAITFITLITRPLRQMDRAIHQLGKGGFEQDIRIEGPQDLQELGARLDWLRNRLSELEHQRSRFLRHISHELKTPLAAIQESVALLNEGISGNLNTKQLELTAILDANCRRLQQLIENLLRFRVDEVGNLGASRQLVRLDMVLEQVIQDQALTAQLSNIRIERNIAKASVRGNREQLRVAIDNLLTNAIRYSPEGGSIHIEVATENRGVTFDIRDQGPGIPVEEREKVFEAFYRGAPPHRGQLQGTGLGLSIAEEYIAMNGGRIEIKDTEQGAHFHVHIPYVEDA